MVKKYEEPKAGEWVIPVMRGYKLACCDCGLVHRIDFSTFRKGKRFKNGSYEVIEGAVAGVFVKFKVYRDNRATSAVRREDKKRKKNA